MPGHLQSSGMLLLESSRSLTPPATEDIISSVGLDSLGVLDELPRQLGECLAVESAPSLLGPEVVLLTVAGIPHPIHEEIYHRQEAQCDRIPVICRRVVRSQVQRAVAVNHWYPGEVPEDQHESPFLIIHIPADCQSDVFEEIRSTYQLVIISSSALEQALAYRK